MKKKLLSFLKAIISFFKRIWHTKIKRTLHVTKVSKCKHDVVLGLLRKYHATNLKEGVKVVTREGVGSIKEVNGDWIKISFPYGRIVEHKVNKVYQYFISVHRRWEQYDKLYPLSYSNYEHIHPKEKPNTWFEGFVTSKEYFKLTEEQENERKNLPIFYKVRNGISILLKLEENGDDLEIKRGLLLIKTEQNDYKNH